MRMLKMGLLTLVTTICIADNVVAQPSPSKPINLVIPFPAGGGTDVIGRLLTQKVSAAMGRQILIENRPGAGGAIATEAVARAVPDGDTLILSTNSAHVIGPLLNTKLRYNPEVDFTPVVYLGAAPRLLLVTKSLPVKSLKDLVALAKVRPGALNYASNGVGTITHLTTELFKSEVGISIEHIVYKGTTLALTDLITGQVQVIFESIVTGLPHVIDGKLRGLAITSLKRSALAPHLATMSEAGVPNFEASTWFGVFGPKGLPGPVVTRLNAEFNRALTDAEVIDRLATLGTDPGGGTPSQLVSIVNSDWTKWQKVIRERIALVP